VWFYSVSRFMEIKFNKQKLAKIDQMVRFKLTYMKGRKASINLGYVYKLRILCKKFRGFYINYKFLRKGWFLGVKLRRFLKIAKFYNFVLLNFVLYFEKIGNNLVRLRVGKMENLNHSFSGLFFDILSFFIRGLYFYVKVFRRFIPRRSKSF